MVTTKTDFEPHVLSCQLVWEITEFRNVFYRYPSGWKALFLVLYTPFGLVLAGIRLLLALQALLVAALFPQLPAVKR
jgi:hypothetical protein